MPGRSISVKFNTATDKHNNNNSSQDTALRQLENKTYHSINAIGALHSQAIHNKGTASTTELQNTV